MKVSELEGVRLNWWVAKAEGSRKCMRIDGEYIVDYRAERPLMGMRFNGPPDYSENWYQGGPIIEREKIELQCRSKGGGAYIGEWLARIDGPRIVSGPTPLVAAMRCYVASRFGEEVPEE